MAEELCLASQVPAMCHTALPLRRGLGDHLSKTGQDWPGLHVACQSSLPGQHGTAE